MDLLSYQLKLFIHKQNYTLFNNIITIQLDNLFTLKADKKLGCFNYW